MPKGCIDFGNALSWIDGRAEFLRRFLLLGLLVFIAGCKGGGGNGTPTPVTPISNVEIGSPWVFGFTSSSSGISGSSTNALVVNTNLILSSQVQSTNMIVIRACIRPSFSSESVTGSLAGGSVSLMLAFGGVTMLLTGTISADGSTMSGTYTMSGACGNDTGSWRANKVSGPNGAYAGYSQLASNPALNSTITANFVSGNNGSVTGTLSVSSTCFKGSLNVTGMQVGNQFGGTGSDAFGDSVEFAFIGDLLFHTMNGTLIVDSGPCTGAAGSVTLGQTQNGGGPPQTDAVPIISLLSPSKVAGVTTASVTVLGNNFTASAQVLVNGVAVPTIFRGAGTLQATITGGPAIVTLMISVRDVGGTSDALPFTFYVPIQGSQPFNAVPAFSAGGEVNPTELGVADIDGDGLADVILSAIVPNGSQPSVAVLHGRSDGSLSVPTYITGVSADVLAVGDVNGDGETDIVTAHSDNISTTTITSLINDGHGNFTQLAAGSVATVNPGQAMLAPVYGTGKPDLLISFFSALYLLKNNGAGTFGSPQLIATTSLTNRRFAVGDLNGDGRPDVMYISTNSSTGIDEIHILFNQRNGSFSDVLASGMAGVFGTAGAGGYITVGDLNMDGCVDAAVQTGTGAGVTLQVFLNHCDGTFSKVSSSPIPSNGGSNLFTPFGFYDFVLGDFDHDGVTDLAGVNGSINPSQMIFLWGDGQGNFTSQFVNGPNGSIAATGDVNGDGLPDVITVDDFENSSSPVGQAVSLVLGRKDRNFPSISFLPLHLSSNMSLADVNGDGIADLFFAGLGLNSGTIFLGQSNGTFTFGANVSPDAILMADVNGDGFADLIGTDGTNLLVWPGNGNPAFSSAPIVIGPAPPGVFSSPLKIADIDRDGHVDIIVQGTIYFGQGNFQFESAQFASLFGPFAIGDLNNDGLPDIVGGGMTLLNQGNRSFKAILSNVPSSADGPVLADFNGDGFLDLATFSGNVVQVAYGLGNGTFYVQGTLSLPDQISSIISSDFNVDGKPDIAIGFLNSHEVTVLTNDGQGGFQLFSFASGRSLQLLVGDFNKDGKPDLAVWGSGSALVMLHN